MFTKSVWDPIDTSGIKFIFPGVSDVNLRELLPYYYNDLKFIGDSAVANRIIAGVIKCVVMGENKFQQAFGGWTPESNQFGLNPLRPSHVQKSSTRWRWVSGTTSSVYWSAEDTFIASFNLTSQQMMMIFGYFNLEAVPNTTELFIQPGAMKIPILTIEPMRFKQEPYFIFPEPIIVEPRSQFAVKAACKSGTVATAEEAGLLGYMFSTNAALISEKRVTT